MALPTCGRPNRTNGEPCQKPAGYGTDHVGEGACKFHGGCTPIKHGRYSQVKGTLGVKIAEHAKNPDPLDLLPELATLRALFERWIDKEREQETSETVAGAEKLIDGMRKTVDTIHKMQTRDLLTSREMEMAIQEIARIISEEVKDPETVQRIANRFAAAFSIRTSDTARAISEVC